MDCFVTSRKLQVRMQTVGKISVTLVFALAFCGIYSNGLYVEIAQMSLTRKKRGR